MKKSLSILWFRQDLRLTDNPALVAASQSDAVLPIYIVDTKNSGDYALGEASQCWLHHSLTSLNESLGKKLSVYRGDPAVILKKLCKNFDVSSVFWNRCYEPWRIQRDSAIKKQLLEADIHVESFNASLLWEPWSIQKKDGTHYKVFTPFYRKGCLQAEPPRPPMKQPSNVVYKHDSNALKLADLKLLPSKNWHENLCDQWNIGEDGARKQLQNFVKNGLNHYKDGRNFPAKPYISRLSPHLHFGEISPNQIWHKVYPLIDSKNADHFCSELGWREFSYSQLYHQPELPTVNLQSKFDAFPWSKSKSHLTAWQQGKTGIPMVDAGMRELWQTGFMHNRVRMVVGSFLVKNLLIDWREGERWFWNTLFDADLANNSASWQWVAGCGADAAPYFRIFNPVTQGQKFDPDGVYIRKFLPEIAELPNKYLFSPWEAPQLVLDMAQIKLGDTYPKPIVDLKTSREIALETFKSLS